MKMMCTYNLSADHYTDQRPMVILYGYNYNYVFYTYLDVY